MLFASDREIKYFKPFESVFKSNLFELDLKESSYDSQSRIIIGYDAPSVKWIDSNTGILLKTSSLDELNIIGDCLLGQK